MSFVSDNFQKSLSGFVDRRGGDFILVLQGKICDARKIKKIQTPFENRAVYSSLVSKQQELFP
jgi:hypothetical protein